MYADSYNGTLLGTHMLEVQRTNDIEALMTLKVNCKVIGQKLVQNSQTVLDRAIITIKRQ